MCDRSRATSTNGVPEGATTFPRVSADAWRRCVCIYISTARELLHFTAPACRTRAGSFPARAAGLAYYEQLLDTILTECTSSRRSGVDEECRSSVVVVPVVPVVAVVPAVVDVAAELSDFSRPVTVTLWPT